jgi:hypothetical protein
MFTARYGLNRLIRLNLNSAVNLLVYVCFVSIGIRAGLCNYVLSEHGFMRLYADAQTPVGKSGEG